MQPLIRQLPPRQHLLRPHSVFPLHIFPSIHIVFIYTLIFFNHVLTYFPILLIFFFCIFLQLEFFSVCLLFFSYSPNTLFHIFLTYSTFLVVCFHILPPTSNMYILKNASTRTHFYRIPRGVAPGTPPFLINNSGKKEQPFSDSRCVGVS